MPALFDCREVARRFFDWTAEAGAKLPFTPRLATLLSASFDDPANRQYRDFISKDALKLGIPCDHREVRSASEVPAALAELNADPQVTGIMVLYPVGAPMRDEEVMDLVSPAKDIEGLHSTNLGYLIKYRRFLDESRGVKCVVPATAKAVVKTFLHYPEVRVEGAFAVIINNSMRVGKPLGLMLENLGATVVKCYDKTPRPLIEDCVRRADILVTAVPDPKFALDLSWIKRGAAVVDVSFQGNIDLGASAGGCAAAYITSPDNRIGRVTRAMTFVNLIYCAQAKANAGFGPTRQSE
ncbi:MAG: bifunctional 5,10-methylenetetrahydrofolate dehydrogenase/5,10-methenyltetrahydrofolate cyclohydrolase [Elusimicrobia bacterium]|nr:bifunctional 5,10-methylenetetrahydrofolate dehydrogenase/5,10-methenyltetrahydrofolate cyclohydrolase [Elusimicrobiota bacterium]